VNFAVHFIRARSSLILSYSSGPFLFYITLCWSNEEKHLQTELNYLKLALQKNGYDKKNVTKRITKHANKTTVSDRRKDPINSYVKGTTDQIAGY